MKIFSWILFIQVLEFANGSFKVDTQDLRILVGDNKSFELYLTHKLPAQVKVTLNVQHSYLLEIEPVAFNVTANEENLHWNISVSGFSPGASVISTNVAPNITDSSTAFVRVTIERSRVLNYLSKAVGWVYFLAWSFSFYPQIYDNYKRKSVVGLSVDLFALNIVGYLTYSLFNCGLYWIPEVDAEYYRRYPRGLNPVQSNDIFFAVHGLLASAVTLVQCRIYEAGAQRVSMTAGILIGLFTISTVISIVLGIFKIIVWLDFFYFCSYIKLFVTLMKYIPQAYSNYKRKSTVGWSIGTVISDFTGGILSMLQMILDSYNYDDWGSIFGDFTKFGLGVSSVAFDILFFLQHYAFYRYEPDLLKSNSFINILA
ncbi:cystinosin homolog [Microplitis mediator]|uniref:cystinosin homolog n=1 Tax=Microplitis mediator TaxID=375433 RepID=UPI00255654C0|nr:cystinosin homolog [Microplitis mediator]XP_057334908.1 cystinosin homolog [Microplitis mediator]